MSTVKSILKLFTQGSYSSQTCREFYEWLVNPVLQQEKDEVLQQEWDELMNDNLKVNKGAYKIVLSRIGGGRPSMMRGRVAMVAAILVILLLSTAVTSLYIRNNDPAEMIESITAYGQLRSVTLPDGSLVKLNAGTTLIYPSEFRSNERRVFLSGEANFNVVKDNNKPFFVATSDISVKVLGTIFNVSSYSDDDFFATTLRQGSVEISILDNDCDPILLAPNEQLTYNKTTGDISKHKVNIHDTSSWENGEIVVRGASLGNLIKMAERRYGVRVYLSTDCYESAVITAEFIHNESVEDFFTVCCYMIPGMKYRIDGNKVYIY